MICDGCADLGMKMMMAHFEKDEARKVVFADISSWSGDISSFHFSLHPLNESNSRSRQYKDITSVLVM